jgi:hypothetical protein
MPAMMPFFGRSPNAYAAAVSWTEADSRLYQELAAVAVPDGAEQMAALLTLLPFGPGDAARVVELGCGEGRPVRSFLLGLTPPFQELSAGADAPVSGAFCWG